MLTKKEVEEILTKLGRQVKIRAYAHDPKRRFASPPVFKDWFVSGNKKR